MTIFQSYVAIYQRLNQLRKPHGSPGLPTARAAGGNRMAHQTGPIARWPAAWWVPSIDVSLNHWFNGLVDGKIYRKPLIFPWTMGFSCYFSFTPISWLVFPSTSHPIHIISGIGSFRQPGHGSRWPGTIHPCTWHRPVVLENPRNLQPSLSFLWKMAIEIVWLVVYLPLWEIWVRQLGWRTSQYMEK